MSTKAEDTQKNILDTARKHFLKDGLTGASLRNIVKDAGLTTGAFYKYYPTKEALFDALTDPYMEHIYQIYDQIVEEFEKLSASDQTRNMSDTSSDGMEQMVDYIYDHYDNFRLLLKCGDSGKFESFIHNMVEREMKSSRKYIEKMKIIKVSNINNAIEKLKKYGYDFVDPDIGSLACGYKAIGKLANNERIVAYLSTLFMGGKQ
jgi:AcrR family transcriptional regulator